MFFSCSNPAPDDEKIIKYNTDHNQGNFDIWSFLLSAIEI